jgi:hypothetical protein
MDANNSGGASNSKIINSSIRDTSDISNIWVASSSRDDRKCSECKPTTAATTVTAGTPITVVTQRAGLHREHKECNNIGVASCSGNAINRRDATATGLTAAAIGKSANS